MLLLVFIFQATREEKKSTHQNENELRDGRKNTEPKWKIQLFQRSVSYVQLCVT